MYVDGSEALMHRIVGKCLSFIGCREVIQLRVCVCIGRTVRFSPFRPRHIVLRTS